MSQEAIDNLRALAVRSEVGVARNFGEMLIVGKTLLDSGFLPKAIKTAPQAVAIILKGRELGLGEMQSLCSINVIEGKTSLSAELMMSLARARGGVVAEIIESTDERCSIKFTRPGQKPHTATFTMEDANKLGLPQRGDDPKKNNYVRQPAVMLQWRCVSKGLRFYASDVLGGAVYTPGEIEEGVIDTELVPPAAAAPEPVKEIKVEPVAQPVADDEEYLTALRKEEERVGHKAFMDLLGLAGYTTPTEILEPERRVEFYKALRALPTRTRTSEIRDKVAATVAAAEASHPSQGSFE